MEELDSLLQEMEVGGRFPGVPSLHADPPLASDQDPHKHRASSRRGTRGLSSNLNTSKCVLIVVPTMFQQIGRAVRVTGYSRCESCFYTVDPTNRPSSKQLEAQRLATMESLRPTSTNALALLQQTRIRDNTEVLQTRGTNKTNFELFKAAQSNDIKTIKRLLDLGADVNCIDFDTGSSPLHWACAKSQQHAIRLLVERGANINAQNKRGLTPLHSLIINRVEPLALWLIKKGADIYITNNEGHTPVDLALPWTQSEMRNLYEQVRSGALSEQQLQPPELPKVIKNERSGSTTLPTSEQAVAREEKEIMKIFLKNDAYKSLIVSNNTTAQLIAHQMAEKLNLGADFTRYFEVLERVKQGDRYLERRLDPNANLFQLKAKWPLIFGQTGNETHLHCRRKKRLFVHPSKFSKMAQEKVFLVSLLQQQLRRKIYPVHRLDFFVSGCFLFALDPTWAHILHQGMRCSSARKTYIAQVRGITKGNDCVELHKPLSSGPKNKSKESTSVIRCVAPIRPAAAPADGAVVPVEAGRINKGSSLFLIQPRTGRYHQVRRHCRHLSHPILGDGQHGDSHVNRYWAELGLPRLALHCLAIDIPLLTSYLPVDHLNNEKATAHQELTNTLRLRVVCPLPDDLAQFWRSMNWWEEAVQCLPILTEKPNSQPHQECWPIPDLRPSVIFMNK
ncbi:Ankyrin repeat containing Ras association (RalGDS/AF6) domain containing protein [Balamuthia mandrillaris]